MSSTSRRCVVAALAAFAVFFAAATPLASAGVPEVAHFTRPVDEPGAGTPAVCVTSDDPSRACGGDSSIGQLLLAGLGFVIVVGIVAALRDRS